MKKISDETLMDIYDTLDDAWTDLEHLKGRIYSPENNPDTVDRHCNCIYGIQQVIEMYKSLIRIQIEEF